MQPPYDRATSLMSSKTRAVSLNSHINSYSAARSDVSLRFFNDVVVELDVLFSVQTSYSNPQSDYQMRGMADMLS